MVDARAFNPDRQAFEKFLRPGDGGGRHPGQACHLHAPGPSGPSCFEAMQEDDLFPPFAHQHVQVLDPASGVGQISQFVVVGGEQGASAQVGQVFRDRPREGQPIKGAGAAANFIQHHQRVRRGGVQNGRRFGHFHHERGATGVQFIARPDSSEDAVASADRGRGRRHIRPSMGQEGEQGRRSNGRAFAGHVGARDQCQSGFTATEFDINRHEFRAQQSIQHRMARASQIALR